MARKRMEQQGELAFPPGRGGARKGAGRPRRFSRPRVSHTIRERVTRHDPVHVVMRLRGALPNLRQRNELRVIQEAFRRGKERFGFRLVHYSVQHEHLHLVVEASSARALSRGMQGLAIRVAKALNRAWARRGKVFLDRYFSRVLRTPREVRNALHYVLQNFLKHGGRGLGRPDPFSSGREFDGWRREEWSVGARDPGAGPRARVDGRSWLLRVGWRRQGLLSVFDKKGSEGPPIAWA